LQPLLNKNIEELILGCSHYPLIYDFLRKKINSDIKIIDPSEALIKKFNEYFAMLKTYRYESLSFENVKFFVTSEREEFSKKVKFWLGINKEIRLVNLRSNV
jgi:glutamate racemase